MIGLTPDAIAHSLLELSKRRFAEPVPPFDELDISKLASALKTPFLRPTPEKESKEYVLATIAHLFCVMVESHYAPNANKRLAVVSLFTVLEFNGFELKASRIRMYAVAMAVTWLAKYDLFDKAIDEVNLFLTEEVEQIERPRISKSELRRLEKEFVSFMQSRT